jgi:hypothetical protein
LRWTALSAGLHLAWELAQLPLYTIYRQSELPRSGRWPRDRPWAGLAVAVLAGVAYTAFSEWRNVYRLGAWTYTDAMPLVLGIGLAPLLQWVLVPALALAALRCLTQVNSARAAAPKMPL